MGMLHIRTWDSPPFFVVLLHSSPTVSKAIPTLKAGLSLQTYRAAYAPFTGGAAGNRTLVQTRNPYAFYMLSFLLVFEYSPEKSTQTIP